MQTLFLDIATHRKTVALVTEKSAVTQGFPDLTDEATLLPFLEDFLKKNKASFTSLTHLATVIGPGGFMSLRTGITLMNTLQWQLGIPMTGIHLSDVWEARAIGGQRSAASDLLWIHSTKKEAFFVRGFGSYEKRWKEPTLIALTDLQSDIDHETPYVGELLDEQKKKLPKLIPFDQIAPLKDILPGFLKHQAFDKKSVQPWYGRGA